jgi:hypothetical protein
MKEEPLRGDVVSPFPMQSALSTSVDELSDVDEVGFWLFRRFAEPVPQNSGGCIRFSKEENLAPSAKLYSKINTLCLKYAHTHCTCVRLRIVIIVERWEGGGKGGNTWEESARKKRKQDIYSVRGYFSESYAFRTRECYKLQGEDQVDKGTERDGKDSAAHVARRMESSSLDATAHHSNYPLLLST